MAAARSLTIYILRSTIQGETLAEFDQAIDPETLGRLTTYDLPDGFEFAARLYVLAPQRGEPPWVSFLRTGFGDEVTATPTAANRAVMILRVRYYNADRYFALTFGMGRYLLHRDAWDRGSGLKAALNIIYEGDDVDALTAPARVRRVDAKTVAQNTLRTSRQTNQYATFETFGMDIQRDFLGGVTGTPADKDKWGTRVVGSDAIHLTLPVEFKQLGGACKRLWRAARQQDYKARFDWIDNVRTVTDPTALEGLRGSLATRLQEGEVDALELGPPQLVDWDQIDAFVFSLDEERLLPDLALADYLELVEEAQETESLGFEKLKRDRVQAMNSAGDVLFEWPVFRCLGGEIEHDGTTHLLDEGQFLQVEPGYLAALDDYVENLDECPVNLPDSPMVGDKEQSEGDYNITAAEFSDGHLLLDKATVKVATHTSPIEVCDVLTTDGRFIHVKRKLQSNQLSHLFSQGYVSADLFLMSPEYRQKTKEAITKAEDERVHASGSEEFRGRFTESLNFDAVAPSRLEVVYAIVAKWNGRELVDALPFFSKVNLRRHADDLRRMGYRVSYKRIDVV